VRCILIRTSSWQKSWFTVLKHKSGGDDY